MNSRSQSILVFLTLGSVAMTWTCLASLKIDAAERPNVLFLAVDDLRPQLHCYGVEHMKTPNIDRLASEGVRFRHHYVQFAVCIPSRVALLTSIRSDKTHQVYGPMQWQKVEGAKPLGKTFSAAGYHTVSLGKIWHAMGGPSGDAFDTVWTGSGGAYVSEKAVEEFAKRKDTQSGKPTGLDLPPITEAGDVDDEGYLDGQIAARAIEELQAAAENDRPFMIAVGFKKPHLPFCAPKKYWDLYRVEDLPLAANVDFPRDMPQIAFNRHPNFFTYDYGPYAPLVMDDRMPDATARHLIHAYSACVSYVDAQIGKVLAELDRLDLRKNTAVVLWGDHGFHLGDSGMWSKHSNFEAASHSPLIARVPWKSARGAVCDAMVETVDIFPTLLELCNLPPLAVSDGQSFAPLLDDPTLPGEDAALHVFTRSTTVHGKSERALGHAIRTQRFRYVRWHVGWDIDGQVVAEELYDYQNDPNETKNVAADPEYAETRGELAAKLEEMVKGSLK